jgi:hypothetical protein
MKLYRSRVNYLLHITRCWRGGQKFCEIYIFEHGDLRGMTNIEITWYLGRAIDDIRNVEEKVRDEEDANILRDIRAKLHKLRVKYDLLKS